MSITRDEIRALCAEHDRLMAAAADERRIYAEGRFRSGSPPGPLTDGADIIYPQHDNSAPAPAPEPEYDWSAWEAWMQGHLNILREELLDGVAEGMNLYVAEKLNEERNIFERKLNELRCENAEIKGMLGTMLRLYAGETKAAIVDLPDWRKRDVA